VGSRGLLIAFLGLAGFTGVAHAFPQEHLDAAKTAIKAGDKRSARDALGRAYDAFARSEGVAPNEILATYWFYQGLLFNQRKKSQDAMDAFRQALVVERQFVWDREVNDDRELRKVFEALRGEVASRETISPQVPEKMGCAQAYVDGSRVVGGEAEVAIGWRLVQIQCPHGDVYGAWTDFGPENPVDWLGLCPYPVDTSIVIPESSEAESEFEGVDVDFGQAPVDDSSPCLDIMTQPPPVVAVAEAPVNPAARSQSNFMHSTFGADSWTTPRIITVGAGGVLIASGIAVHYAGVVPAYAMVEWGRRNPTGLTRYQADILTDRFRTRRSVSYALTATGVVTTAVGLFVLKPKSTHMQPVLLPHGMGLHGRF
jgi:hypothetical protein